MEKINQRVMLTKRLLQEGILRLLEHKNIEQINVTELCRESGINRATFYTHYQMPQDVLWEIEEELLRQLSEEIRRKWKTGSDDRPKAFAEIICFFFYNHADLARIIVRNAADRSLSAMLTNSFISVLKQFFPKDIDAESMRLIAAYLAGGSYFLLKQWLEDDMEKSPEEVAKLLDKLFNENFWS